MKTKKHPMLGKKNPRRAELNSERKGKVLEEIYGEEKAYEIRKKLRNQRGNENNPNWKGGSYPYYHRIARKTMEQQMGRQLMKGETVHHINGNCKDNEISNLIVFKSNSEHIKKHAKEEKYSERIVEWSKNNKEKRKDFIPKRDKSGRFVKK